MLTRRKRAGAADSDETHRRRTRILHRGQEGSSARTLVVGDGPVHAVRRHLDLHRRRQIPHVTCGVHVEAAHDRTRPEIQQQPIRCPLAPCDRQRSPRGDDWRKGCGGQLEQEAAARHAQTLHARLRLDERLRRQRIARRVHHHIQRASATELGQDRRILSAKRPLDHAHLRRHVSGVAVDDRQAIRHRLIHRPDRQAEIVDRQVQQSPAPFHVGQPAGWHAHRHRRDRAVDPESGEHEQAEHSLMTESRRQVSDGDAGRHTETHRCQQEKACRDAQAAEAGQPDQPLVRMPQRRRRERRVSRSETESGRDQRTHDVEPEHP